MSLERKIPIGRFRPLRATLASDASGGNTLNKSWTSSRPRAAIYAPGCLDVLPVY
jgi:hypothetical protein